MDLPAHLPTYLNASPSGRSPYPSASLLHSNDLRWYWNFYQFPIDYAFRPRLRSRLTLGGRAFLRKPQIFGGQDSHLPFRILIPAFSLLSAPALLSVYLRRPKNAPLPYIFQCIRSFGGMFEPRYIFGAKPLDQ